MTGQLILLGLVMNLLVLIGLALCIIPGIFLQVAWLFAIALVIDRRMNFWDAMELSRKMVCKHWFIVFAFLIVYGLVVVAGLIACCIGILFTAPIGIAATGCMPMKPSSPGRKPVSRAKAKNAAMLNLLATPGLGSLLCGRWIAGIGQLALAFAGFAIVHASLPPR